MLTCPSTIEMGELEVLRSPAQRDEPIKQRIFKAVIKPMHYGAVVGSTALYQFPGEDTAFSFLAHMCFSQLQSLIFSCRVIRKTGMAGMHCTCKKLKKGTFCWVSDLCTPLRPRRSALHGQDLLL